MSLGAFLRLWSWLLRLLLAILDDVRNEVLAAWPDLVAEPREKQAEILVGDHSGSATSMILLTTSRPPHMCCA